MSGKTEAAARARRDSYHHGNLRQGLIEAALAIVAEQGLAAVTLRACASRAGVSHAAPAHHFGNLQGLLSELAAVAFRRFHATIAAEQAAAGPDPRAQLAAAGCGYLRFATANPDLFRLMFSAGRLDWTNTTLAEASRAAYRQLADTVRPFQRDPDDEEEGVRLRTLVWSMVHGYAHLLLEGYLAQHGVSADGLSHLPDIAALLPYPPSDG
jgi:AcrR family transcriptional regulator